MWSNSWTSISWVNSAIYGQEEEQQVAGRNTEQAMSVNKEDVNTLADTSQTRDNKKKAMKWNGVALKWWSTEITGRLIQFKSQVISSYS